MWPGFDPVIKKELANIRRMVALKHQTPTMEWPLIVVELEKQRALLVVREWPDGSITAYAAELPQS
jgi:hypothetical protein